MPRFIVILGILLCFICIATPVLADEINQQSTTETITQIQPISPQEGAQRLENGFMRLYLAILTVIPNFAMVALLVGVILSIIFAAIGAKKILTGTIVGLAVIILMVAVSYSAPFIISMAKGIGQGL